MNGTIFAKALISGANLISNRKNQIDELNVFPVPDGDTGTNMTMTVLAASRVLEQLSSPTVSEVANKTATAMLRGARGNSGVILSLLFRGIANGLKGVKELSASSLADALEGAVKEAYGAVMKPTEGTILTVARLSAQEARRVSDQPLEDAFEAIFKVAKDTLKQTTEMLPVLKKAGVVDAGGMGWLTMLEGMKLVFEGKEGVKREEASEKKLVNPVAEFEGEINFTYCTEYIINRKNGNDPIALRAYLETLGDSVVVVADDDIIKVHVHTDHPGNAIEEALKFGPLVNMKIENMREQHQDKAHAAKQYKKSAEYKAVDPDVEYGFVAVGAGDGIKGLFKDLGAEGVVNGGQTMNPSTEDLLEAIQSVGAKTVFVMPNNKNIIMASEQAAELADRDVVVMQTRTIPEGISAMLCFDPDVSLDENKAMMSKAVDAVKTGLVTFAARDSCFDGKQIGKNEILALTEGKIYFTEKDASKAAYKLIKKLTTSSSTFATVFYGEGISEEQALELKNKLEDKFGEDLEINLVNGGQPVYYYIVSVE